MKKLIKNGTIVDGTGKAGYRGDILTENDRIVRITPSKLSDTNYNAEIIDASGLIVAPGFIDTHSHNDLKILTEPEALQKLMQGITTEVLGQDGISIAPLPVRYISQWRKILSRLDGDSDEIDWTYENTDRYLNMIEKAKPGLNECYLVPHGNIRMEAMGLLDRRPTAAELRKMADITRREMGAGAFGLSTGLIYAPCAYGGIEELIEMCKAVAEYDGLLAVHQRSEADSILDSMKEVIRIGRESGVRIHFSHFKVCGKNNWDKLDDMLCLLEEAQADGVRISFDQYPYAYGSTTLDVILPLWVHDGGVAKAVERLRDPALRERMIRDIEQGIAGWDNYLSSVGADGIYVTSVKTDRNKDAIGLNLTELARLRGKDVYEATFDLLLEEENAVGMIDFYGTEEHVIRLMKRREMNACTDGLPDSNHPRLYGSYPRILGKYVREEKTLTLEEAVYKMTKKPADTFRIKDRGEIREGAYADICIFDHDTIMDKGTFTDPAQYPEGIEYVIINGEFAVKNGRDTGIRNGRSLRKENLREG